MHWIALVLALGFASLASAQTIYRCVDESGKTTFSQMGCGAAPSIDQEYDARNVPPSGGSEVVPMAGPDLYPRQQRPARVTVVGEPESPCEKYRGRHPGGGLSQGFFRGEYGRPDRISNYNGRESWTWYSKGRAPYRSVDFDENGCATSHYQSATGR